MILHKLSFVAILIAGPLLAFSDDLESSFQSLKEAEAKKDVALIKKLAGETSALAREIIESSAPQGGPEKEAWAKHVAYAREVDQYTEYSLYAAASQSPPETLIDLIVTLEQQSPKSKYLDEAYGRYFLALHQTKAAQKIPGIAAKAILSLPENEDLLIVLSDNALAKRQNDRAFGYAERLIAALTKHGKPEGMSAADWDRKKTAALGRARWIAGLIHADKTQYFEADKDLRAALPLIKGNNAMLGPALFQLGIANYQLGRSTMNKGLVLEAVKFSEQAAAIPGAHQHQAWANAQIMKTEAGKMR